MDDSFFICFIEFSQSICEKTKCCSSIDAVSFSTFQFSSNFDDTVSGRNHVINDDYIFSFYRRTKEFVGNDRITSVYDFGIISSLVEHTHIKTKYVGKINGTVCTTFIRADCHHVFAVDFKIFYCAQKTFDKLVCW